METPAAPAVTFESFGLRAEVLTALKGLGYEEPTPIQRETIPALISGRDVLGQAATGTGKTAAFALPMLELVTPKDRRPFEAQALVLVPTRELAMQVAEAVQKYGAGMGVTALAVYGGQEIFNQVRPLKRGVDVVVATPGRALDHIARKTLLLSKVKFVVLDEADEMLDMGFEDDLKAILNELPAQRQTALFSATLPSRISKIAEKHLKDPVRVSIVARAQDAGTLPTIRQAAYVVQRKHKEAALMRVLEWESPQSALIFCRTRNEVEELSHVLMRSGYAPAALHGGLTQEQRDGVLKRFKEGAVRVLVATDVAARGLHVEALSHVINFDLPTSPEVYVHRIGRTGRAGKEGVALSFLDPREMRLLGNVERQIKRKMTMLQVPTRAQLDAKRSETVAARVKAAMEAPNADFMILANRAAEGSTMEVVAAAAMALLQQQLFPPHESDSVDFKSSADRGPARADRGARPERGDRPERGERPERGPRPDRGERPSGPRAGMTALTLSLGSHAGVRPQDLVGAIANEANLPSKQISGIRVDEYTSRVEVPTEAVERVIQAMHATKVRGRKVRVELESEAGAKAAARTDAARARKEEAVPPRGSAPRAGAPRISAPRAKRAEAAEEEVSAPRGSAPRARPEQHVAEVSGPRGSAPRAEKAHGDKPRFGDQARFNGKPRPMDATGDEAPATREPSGADESPAPEKPRFGRDKPRFGDKPRFTGGAAGDEKSAGADKPRFGADKPRFGSKPGFGDKPRFTREAPQAGAERSSGGDKPRFGGDKPRFGSDKPPFGDVPRERPPFGDKSKFGDRPKFGKPFSDKPSRFGGGSRPARAGRMEPKKR
ncbi:MAG: DEAD/DEAH box helicase [Archangium sp.]|nr:DEAD/DEAH box helicase [Archangium sp.]